MQFTFTLNSTFLLHICLMSDLIYFIQLPHSYSFNVTLLLSESDMKHSHEDSPGALSRVLSSESWVCSRSVCPAEFPHEFRWDEGEFPPPALSYCSHLPWLPYFHQHNHCIYYHHCRTVVH